MIRPRWQKVLSDLWGNRVRSLLVIASISVGLFAVGIIVKIWVVISDDMKFGYAAANPANIQIITNPFDQDLVDRIKHIDGVHNAEGIFTTDARVKTGPDEWSSINLKAYTHFEEMQINQVELIEGTWPPKKDEIVIDRNKLEDLHAGVGDRIEIELSSGKSHSFLIVGIVRDQTIGANNIGGGFFVAPIQGYILNKTLAHLGAPDVYNQLYVTVTGDSTDQEHINRISDSVREAVEDSGRQVLNTVNRRSDDHPNNTYVDAIAGVLLLLGLFIVFLSGFLVTNTISALLTQQIQQIGIMKTVGARRYQVISLYMIILLIYGLLACMFAIPLSDLAANRILEYLALKINFALQRHWLTPLAVILQVLIALLVPQIAGFSPILHASKITVQEAISGMEQADGTRKKKSWLDRKLIKIKGIPRPLVISLRNTFRKKGRLILTLITLSFGGAVFIATFNVRSSLEQYIAQVSKYFLADVNLTFDQPYRLNKIEQELSQIPEINRVEGWASANAGMILGDGSLGESIHILAPSAGSLLIEPVMITGRWIEPGDRNAIVLSERFLSQFPDVQVGDTIELKINGKDTKWYVVGFFRLAGKSGGFLAYANYDYLSEVNGEYYQAVTFRIVARKSGLSIDQQKQLARNIETRLKEKGYDITDITAGSYLFTSASKGLNVLTVFLLIMAVLIALVGSIGLAGTMGMNVMERTREIGVMRSIGASDRVLYRLVLVEGIIIGLISWIFSTLLSFPISKLMSDTINMAIFDATSGFTFTFYGLAIWLIVVVVLSILASVLPARNATRLTIREVLAYE
jgi:putative ABC transport system permease protein